MPIEIPHAAAERWRVLPICAREYAVAADRCATLAAMTVIDVDERRRGTAEELAAAAVAPALWLLEMASADGVPLTQTNALARAVVREIAERWPDWWNAELFGPPHREWDMPLIGALHEGLKRRRLVRRRARKLLITARGRKLATDPIALLYDLGLDLGGGDPFTAMVANVVVEELEENAPCTREQLVRPAHEAAQWGWRGPDGGPPSEQGVSWVVGDVLCRGEAYGLVDHQPDPAEPKSWRTLISLSPAASIGARANPNRGDRPRRVRVRRGAAQRRRRQRQGRGRRARTPHRATRRDPAGVQLGERSPLLVLARRPVLGRCGR